MIGSAHKQPDKVARKNFSSENCFMFKAVWWEFQMWRMWLDHDITSLADFRLISLSMKFKREKKGTSSTVESRPRTTKTDLVKKRVIDVTKLAIRIIEKRKFRTSRWHNAVTKMHILLKDTEMDKDLLQKFENVFKRTIGWMMESPSNFLQSIDVYRCSQ